MSHHTLSYRPDIDGLRAIAVLAVVFFHANMGDWAGGFVGVDVFFVISGYLITSLIIKEKTSNTFSYKEFYERRIRRLLPPLIPVLIFACSYAWIFFLEEDFKDFSQSLAAFFGFNANWHFLNETGYFDAPAELKPLLHTWSLSIEEQYYLIFPAILILLMKYGKALRIGFIVAMLGTSLLFSHLWISQGQNEVAFFSILSRFWELMLGSLLAIASTDKPKAYLIALLMRVVGLAMIFIAIFSYTDETPFPGLNAILPTLGALLVIWAGAQQKDPVYLALGSFPMRWIGKFSYAFYLWHWPIFVFIRIYWDNPPDEYLEIGMGIAFLLSALSYFLIEQPIRQKKWLPSRKAAYLFFTTSFIAFVALGAAGIITKGLPQRFPDDLSERLSLIQKGEKDENPRSKQCFSTTKDHYDDPSRFCMFGDQDATPSFVLWGDSHADALMPALDITAKDQGLSGYFTGYSGCVPLPGAIIEKAPNHGCDHFNEVVLEFIKEHNIKTVVLHARWNAYINGYFPTSQDHKTQDSVQLQLPEGYDDHDTYFIERFSTLINQLSGLNIIVIGPTPVQPVRVPQALAKDVILRRASQTNWTTFKAYKDWNTPITSIFEDYAAQGKITYIDPSEAVCQNKSCDLLTEGRPIYKDDDHLSTTGAMLITPQLIQVFSTTYP